MTNYWTYLELGSPCRVQVGRDAFVPGTITHAPRIIHNKHALDERAADVQLADGTVVQVHPCKLYPPA